MEDKRKKVLVVDDMPRLLEHFSKILEKRGFKPETVENAEDGLRFLNQGGPWDYVFLDHDLGEGRDGTWLAKEIVKSLYVSKETIFFCCSTNVDARDRMASILSGFQVEAVSKIKLMDAIIEGKLK